MSEPVIDAFPERARPTSSMAKLFRPVLFREYVDPLVGPLGFVRRGNVYRLVREPGTGVVVEFQTSTGSRPDSYEFYVNVGLCIRQWTALRKRHLGTTLADDPGISVGESVSHHRIERTPYERLTPAESAHRMAAGERVQDHQLWVVDSVEALHQAGAVFREGFRPSWERLSPLLDPDVLLARLRAGDPLPASGPGGEAVFAVLLADRGEAAEADRVLAALRHVDDEFGAYVRTLAASRTSA